MALRVKKRIPLRRRSDRLAQRVYKREQRQKTTRRIVTLAIVLALLAGGAGLIYTWYIGQTKKVSIQNPPPRKSKVVFKPPAISQMAKVGVSVQSVTTPVTPGSNASIIIRTNPAATCTIRIENAGTKLQDSGLSKKTADEFGMISWAWTFKQTDPTGKWPIDVECKNKKHSAVVESEVVVKS